MAMVQEGPRVLALSEERRRFQRVRVNLLGRYMLADRREFPCQVVDMSPGGMALIAPVNGKAGERVVAYIDTSAGWKVRSSASSRTASP
jgi:c-di-GMP-binding flagellar brake protein YcgR